MIIAIDVDKTLAVDTQKAKEIISNWKKQGHRIIIFTHRGEDLKTVTEKFLKDNQIPYDELILNKPYYNILIDDKVRRFEGWDKDYLK